MPRMSTGIVILVVAFGVEATAGKAIGAEPRTGFARRQLQQMCEDRPDMTGILETDDPVYRWVEGCMDIGPTQRRIYWIALEPERDSAAQHGAASFATPAQLRISSSEKMSGEDRWLCVIFELHNIDNTEDFQKLAYAVANGTITPDEFARRSLLLELAAEVRTKKFLQRHVGSSHRLARSGFYKHYLSLPDKPPVDVSWTDRQRCQTNLDYYRDWAKVQLQSRSMYPPR